MPSVKNDPASPTQELAALRAQNEELLQELETSYAQLAAVIHVSQDETRIAYSELQEKVVVMEKKLSELDLLADIGRVLAFEIDLQALRRTIVEKICLLLPVDLAVLHLTCDTEHGTQRERDMVFEVRIAGEELQRGFQRIIETTAQHGYRATIAADLASEPRLEHLRLRSDACSAAVIPLHGRGLVGVLVLNSRLRGNFRPDQEPLMATFGSHAASALENTLRLGQRERVIAQLMREHNVSLDALASSVSAAQADPPARDRLQGVRDRLQKASAT